MAEELRWGTLEHTADLGLWVEAPALPRLFEDAAVSLGQLMAGGPVGEADQWRSVRLTAAAPEELLVAWLAEVVYLSDAGGLAVAEARVDRLEGGLLEGALGLTAPPHGWAGEPVKAVTYHRAGLRQTGCGWRAQVILDV